MSRPPPNRLSPPDLHPLDEQPDLVAVDHLMQSGVARNVFPGGVLLVSQLGHVAFFKAYGLANIFRAIPMTPHTVFDLASLTKPLATTLAIMHLVQTGSLSLSTALGQVLDDCRHTDKAAITIEHLLRHRSGLADYRPFYKQIEPYPFDQRHSVLKRCLVDEPLEDSIGQQSRYSDLGYMVLRWLVETVSGQRLDHYLDRAVFGPLGLRRASDWGLFFQDRHQSPPIAEVAATELCPWRRSLVEGWVHDENAYVMGGIEGHAGLFGRADAVHRLLLVLVNAYHRFETNPVFESEIIQTFLHRPANGMRPLGFDAPEPVQSSCGRYFSNETIGHLGYTGTSFWVDLKKRIIVVLLTNRVHPTRQNESIKIFRPQLHDTVMAALGHSTS